MPRQAAKLLLRPGLEQLYLSNGSLTANREQSNPYNGKTDLLKSQKTAKAKVSRLVNQQPDGGNCGHSKTNNLST